MGDANDYSKLRGPVAPQGDHDYAAKMAYASDPRNWFKRARGEWPDGMTTSIVVVDGADGLTPDMLRVRPENVESSCTCSPYWPKGDPRHVCTCTPENVEYQT